MDTNRLQKILDNYTDKFESFNTGEAHEIYKWTAVSRFQKYWDPDAENFGEMFKMAVDDAEALIGTSSYQPAAGVAYLCRHSRDLQEAVRDEFRRLLAPDDSDYAARQKRAEAFVTAMNSLLQKVDSGKWKYHQEISSALLYLALADPEDNYLYKEAEVRRFAGYVDDEDEIVLEDSVNLPNYYRLCEEVRSELEQRQDLQDLVSEALQAEADSTDDSSVTEIDGDNHLLAFDVIYCASAYELYDDEPADGRKKKRRKKSLTPAEAEKAKENERLKRELRNVRAKLRRAEHDREALSLPDLTGRVVNHRKYGKGKASGQDGKYLTVVFERTGASRKFILPDALTGGYLTASSDEPLTACQEIAKLEENIRKLNVQADLLNVQINGLDES